ncbi:MAG: hypothetical protein HYY37_06835 [Candidatus Aenigmarchaeota archaeon]|nr:hypothetical protein [Candidatus Aenigmarchaeota archaeon]
MSVSTGRGKSLGIETHPTYLIVVAVPLDPRDMSDIRRVNGPEGYHAGD